MVDIFRIEIRVDVATHIASLGFEQALTGELRHDVQCHLMMGERVYGVYEEGRLMGFAIFDIFAEVLYLSGIILMPEMQGKGVAGQVVRFVQEASGTRYLALRTQSLRMWVAGKNMCREWYPCVQPNDGMLHILGLEIARYLNMTKTIEPGCYGGPLYGNKPVYRDPQLQAWWDSICNFERGDAVLCVGSF